MFQLVNLVHENEWKWYKLGIYNHILSTSYTRWNEHFTPENRPVLIDSNHWFSAKYAVPFREGTPWTGRLTWNLQPTDHPFRIKENDPNQPNLQGGHGTQPLIFSRATQFQWNPSPNRRWSQPAVSQLVVRSRWSVLFREVFSVGGSCR